MKDYHVKNPMQFFWHSLEFNVRLHFICVTSKTFQNYLKKIKSHLSIKI